MVHATGLASHCLQLEPDKDAARLCLYHYLKNLCDPKALVDGEFMNRFFRRALTFDHWQANKAHLFGESHAVLEHYQRTQNVTLPLDGLLNADRIQVIKLENQNHLEQILHRWLSPQTQSYSHYRVIMESDRAVALQLSHERELKVSLFPLLACLIDGELQPLTRDFELSYSSSLLLQPNQWHQMEVAPFTSARFRMDAEGCKGLIIRGYTFQKYLVMDGGSLHRFPVLFYPLKRLEQYFVNRKTDPMYIELTGLLEKAIDLLQDRHPESLKFAKAAFERGRLALEQIFPDDKMVRLLISNLEKSLALEAKATGGSFSMNTDSEKVSLEKAATWEKIRPLNNE